jgi:hypothetical protein
MADGDGVSWSGIFAANLELRRADSRTLHALGPDCIAIDRQAAKRRRISSSGTPASISAPTIMSPEAPEKQSKYRTFTIRQSYSTRAASSPPPPTSNTAGRQRMR